METVGMSDSGLNNNHFKTDGLSCKLGNVGKRTWLARSTRTYFHYENHHSSRAFSFALPLTVAVTICNYNVPKLSGETTAEQLAVSRERANTYK